MDRTKEIWKNTNLIETLESCLIDIPQDDYNYGAYDYGFNDGLRSAISVIQHYLKQYELD